MRSKDQILLEAAVDKIINPKLHALKKFQKETSFETLYKEIEDLKPYIADKAHEVVNTVGGDLGKILDLLEILGQDADGLIGLYLQDLEEKGEIEIVKNFKKSWKFDSEENKALFLKLNYFTDPDTDLNTDIYLAIDNELDEWKDNYSELTQDEIVEDMIHVLKFYQDFLK
jgi:hypothetical protein